MEREGWKQGCQKEGGHNEHRELEIIASNHEVTLGGFQHDWESEWATGSWSLAKPEPFVPAAATFQSATDIYTPGLIERLACEPSACTHTPTPP